MINAKEVLKKACEANLVDDILFGVYQIKKDDYYDAAILAPSWYPEKVFPDDAIITTLKRGSYNSSYVVEYSGLKIAYIQCGSGASNLVDAALCLTNSSIKNIFFVGAVGSISKEIGMSILATPSESISFDGVTPFLNEKLEKELYGKSVYPYNMEYIDNAISKLKENGIEIIKEKVFCTDSIILEYYHMDEIKNTGAKLIEMETAAFYKTLEAMNKNGMAFLLVSDNSSDKKSLVEKSVEDRIKYNYIRKNTIAKCLELLLK